MIKEKQIEKMAKDMCFYCKEVLSQGCKESICEGVRKHAEALYNAGYRKQSEGEWKINTGIRIYGISAVYCSNCSAPARYDKSTRKFISMPYCPNCGAKMKGGAEY